MPDPPIPDLVAIPGGAFRMGSDAGRSDEAPAHLVEIAPFALARTPVTNAHYAPFVRAGGTAPAGWGEPAFADPAQPVVGLTWFDAMDYAAWLSERTGRAWRLPTEAEWERAARGGQEGAVTAWGDALPPAEVPLGPLRGPWPAGRGRPNGYGLFDITTVVHEWCADWYAADYYSRAPRIAPCGPEEGERRVSRGGSWRHHVRWSPPSARSSLPPGFRYADYGVRLAADVD